MKALLFRSSYSDIFNLVCMQKSNNSSIGLFSRVLNILRKWLLTKLTILKITIVLRNIPESRLDDICCPVKLLKKIIFFLNSIECSAFTETAILTDSLERVDCQRFRRGGFYNRGWGAEAKKAGLTGS